MIADCPLCGPSSIPGCGGEFQGIFCWLITLGQPEVSQYGRMAPHNPHVDIEEEGWSPDGQWPDKELCQKGLSELGRKKTIGMWGTLDSQQSCYFETFPH